ncbi:DNA-3-methyladenine glycosylase 2 family protein [Alteromonas gilva]|uniref:Ada metal-binding domain-containing protein n=1 Tax=Alteromonas gilva TaxID=2987522 RepID=A0ABT5KXJ9_9ALTE|nr:Ada metal-binding domain-containing protein [Alteromonas gilva]MDC8829490.1 Ada metal-binding domain-containing protein [Alteromonas gilva]
MISATQSQQYARARLSRDPRFDGCFYVAVRTTGIFCRPICPARLPAEANVTYYHYAQQAIEQGFRPCLRCRPDSAPGSFAWQGVNTTVQRALKLLSNELATPIATIATRLGISERYLNKLISAEVGVSPKRFQLHSRLLFAKRLLQQTSMPVTDIAVAAGFSSERGLQSHLHTQFRLTPTQLRGKHNAVKESAVKESAVEASAVGSTVMQVVLAAKQPYNWPQVRDFLRVRALSGVEQVTDSAYHRQFLIDDKPGEVVATYDAAKGGFMVRLLVAHAAHIQPILTTLRRVLDVDTDPALVSEALLSCGLRPAQVTPGLRLPGVWSVFEAGCRAIVGQQVSVGAAITQLQRITDTLGLPTRTGKVFPSAEAVADNPLDMLKMPGARKQALVRFAQACVARDAGELTDDEILAIKGIGPWTLEYIRMRGRSDPDRFLSSDLIAKRQAAKLAIDAQKAAPWRSYLTLQLWLLAGQQQEDA